MNTKNDWPNDKVDVTDLNLDLQNPRVPKHVKDHNDIKQIRNYLLEKEDVLRIARSIAINGYHRSAVSIVCEEAKKLVVLDGNRRLAACQLLLSPELAPNARSKKELEDLGKLFNRQDLKSIKITVAPSRKEAEKEIWDIHVNRLLKSWEQLQRVRMYKNLIDEDEFNVASAAKEYGTGKGKFAKELAKLYFYEWILELSDDAIEEKMREAGFNAIERLISSKNGKKLLNYDVSSEGMVTFKNKKESEKKLKRLIPYIVGEKKIPAQATKDFLIENVFSKIDPKTFPKKKSSKKNNLFPKPSKLKKQTIESIKSLALKKRRSSRRYPLIEAEEILEYVLVHFDVAARQLLERRDNRKTLEINDEYDVQDLLHALLAMFFDDVVREEWNPSGGASLSRSDFLFLDNGTIVEVKTTLKRNGSSQNIRKKLEAELHNDLMQYTRNPKCKRIYLFVYDPSKKINGPTTFERGMSSNKLKDVKVSTIVNVG